MEFAELEFPPESDPSAAELMAKSKAVAPASQRTADQVLSLVKWVSAIVVSMFGIVTYHGYQAVTDYSGFKAEMKGSVSGLPDFQKNTAKDLADLKVSVAELKALWLSRTLADVARMDQETLIKSLPSLGQALVTPAPRGVIDQGTIRAVAVKLLQLPQHAAGYWPAVLRFLRFAGEASGATGPKPNPPRIYVTRIQPGRLLDNVEIVMDGGSIGGSTIRNSKIVFTANPVELHNAKFENCIFEFNEAVINAPSPYVQEVGKQLLASVDLQSAAITFP